MNKNQMNGRIKDATDTTKEAAREPTDNTSTQMRGAAEKVLGKTQAAYGPAKDVLDKKR